MLIVCRVPASCSQRASSHSRSFGTTRARRSRARTEAPPRADCLRGPGRTEEGRAWMRRRGREGGREGGRSRGREGGRSRGREGGRSRGREGEI